ncbi:MAG: GWxTD domain-containing protein [Acidobacteriota bacterium]
MAMVLKKNKLLSYIITMALIFPMFIVSSWFSACHYYKLEKKLGPDDAEFLSKVRYIITKKEQRLFLDLPEEKREEFKEEFWKRRDPDPSTEENEFKMEYFNRIERANELFISEGKPGWLTDRGRIFILFGPPHERLTYPMGYGSSGRCQEIWYYGNFPVVFLDEYCSGSYRLVTYDLSSLRRLNLRYMHELGLAQARLQQTIRGDSRIFNFQWKVEKKQVAENRLEGKVTVEIPYTVLWFKEINGKLATEITLQLEIFSGSDNKLWEFEQSYQIEADEEQLKTMKGESYLIEIPFSLEEELDELIDGKGKIFATLTNITSEESLKKVMDFKI